MAVVCSRPQRNHEPRAPEAAPIVSAAVSRQGGRQGPCIGSQLRRGRRAVCHDGRQARPRSSRPHRYIGFSLCWGLTFVKNIFSRRLDAAAMTRSVTLALLACAVGAWASAKNGPKPEKALGKKGCDICSGGTVDAYTHAGG